MGKVVFAHPAGLYVIVASVPDARFARGGADLWRNETLAVAHAVFGTMFKVPTLDGAVEVMVRAARNRASCRACTAKACRCSVRAATAISVCTCHPRARAARDRLE